MISVEEADKIIFKNLPKFPIISAPLNATYGQVLREDIDADRDDPAFDKSLVDGVAIKLSAYEKGGRVFKIQGVQAAGQVPGRLSSQKNCFEIMTGAVLPKGCDCIIPVEQITKRGETIVLGEQNLLAGQFFRRKGADHKKGTRLLSQGTLIGTPQIAIAASVGHSRLKITRQPKIAIISTGDELVDIDKKIQPYQTRTSNSYALQAALFQKNFLNTEIFHIPDDEKMLYKKIKTILGQFDVLILSGGVSMGKFDFVPGILKQLNVQVLFHKVSQKPGKPFWFGKNKSSKLVFALPGNPVSTIVCAYRYVLPALRKGMGLRDYQIKTLSQQLVLLDQEIPAHPELTLFVPVKTEMDDRGQLKAQSVQYGGSGNINSLGMSDGFIELKGKMGAYSKNAVVPFYFW